MGRAGHRHAHPGRTIRSRDGPTRATASRRGSCRRRGCSQEFRFRRIRSRRGGLRARRPTGRRTRCRPPCTTPVSRRSGSTPSTCRSKRATSTDFRDSPTRSDARARASRRRSSATCCRCSTRSSPMAAAVGAVNTIVIRDGRWIGTNTDVEGFLEPLQAARATSAVPARPILGAGGAARAVGLRAAAGRCARRHCRARGRKRRRRSRTRSARVRSRWPPRAGSWDLLVNATPVGGRRRCQARPSTSSPRRRLVYDLVYDPDPTELMQARRRAPGVARSAASRCWWRRRSDSSNSGPEPAARRSVRRGRGGDAIRKRES